MFTSSNTMVQVPGDKSGHLLLQKSEYARQQANDSRRKEACSLYPADTIAGHVPGAWRDQPGPVWQTAWRFDPEDGN